jgi:PAS domain S-box-containing protein
MNKNILIVDDLETNIYLLESLLKSKGFKSIVATNGKEALEKLRDNNVLLIISDILMPVMDGFQFCKICKDDNELKNIPFIFYTSSYTEIEDEKFALSIGADKFVSKPIEPSDFIKIVEKLLEEFKSGKLQLRKQSKKSDKNILKEYTKRLVNKLEHKMTDLEKEIEVRNQVEEDLRNYEHIVSTSTDMMALLDKRFTYLAVNESYLDAFGFTADKLVGHTVTQVFGAKFFKTVIKPYADRCLLGEEVHYQDWFDFPAYEDERYMNITYYPFLNEEKKVSGFVVNGRNITERRKMESDLKQSEKHYRQLFELLPYGCEIFDLKGNIVDCNKSTAKLLGYKRKELIGKHIASFLDEKTKKIFKEFYPKVLKGEIVNIEAGMIHKNGDHIDIIRAAEPIFDHNGKIEYVLGLSVDITDRKRAERDLAESEEQYRQFFNEDLSGAFISTPEGKLIECNQAFLDIFGFPSKKDAMEASTYKLYKDAEQRDRKIQLLKEKKKLINYEEKLKNVKGETIYVTTNMRGEFDGGGKLVLLKGYLMDVTKQRLAEKALQDKIKSLKMSNDLFVGRELKMIEIKKEVNELLEKSGKKPKYRIIG